MSFSPLNIVASKPWDCRKIRRISGWEWANNGGRWGLKNTRILGPRKCKKTRGKRWNSRNFPPINWPVNARKKAFSWIHRNSFPRKYKKIPANTGRHHIFQKFIERWTLENKRFLKFTCVCRQGKCKKTTRKLLKTQEHTIISVRLPNGERWKACVFLNYLEFAVSENTRKQEKTSVITGIRSVFRTFTKRWILENSAFC